MKRILSPRLRALCAGALLCTGMSAQAVIISGWDLIDTVTVQTNGALSLAHLALVNGQAYKMAASGSFNIGGYTADAEYIWGRLSPNTGIDYCIFGGLATCDYGIAINDNVPGGYKGTSWGPFNSSSHEYVIDFIGKGATPFFSYHDDNLRDNLGTLQVEIFSRASTSTSTVPEPASLALAAAALGAMALPLRRRHRRCTAPV